MEKYHKLILALGSNDDKSYHISIARRKLSEYFQSIRFSENMLTQPVDWFTDAQFLNCVAIAFTDKDKEEVRSYLKSLEVEYGRSAELKQKGIIPIDIDLLKWDEEFLKPKDLQRTYILSALQAMEDSVH